MDMNRLREEIEKLSNKVDKLSEAEIKIYGPEQYQKDKEALENLRETLKILEKP